MWVGAGNWTFGFVEASTFVMAAVNDVFPWSTCPIVPTFTCGLLRSNFSLPMLVLLFLPYFAHDPRHDLLAHAPGGLHVLLEVHGVGGPALGAGAQVRRIPEHRAEGHHGRDDLRAAPGDLPLHVAA